MDQLSVPSEAHQHKPLEGRGGGSPAGAQGATPEAGEVGAQRGAAVGDWLGHFVTVRGSGGVPRRQSHMPACRGFHVLSINVRDGSFFNYYMLVFCTLG